MRKNILLFLMLMVLVGAKASTKSLDELKDIAAAILSQGQKTKGLQLSSVKMIVFSETDDIAVIGAAGSGFAVLAKDDCHEVVLGYSDSDYENASGNREMQWWLECMTKALANGAVQKEKKPDGVADVVEPFITTHWNQNAPYNNLCPSYTSNGSVKRYPTGCVATAMAQAMNYYKYPANGTSTCLYRFNPGDGTQQTVNVVLDDIKFDWDSMLDTYKTGYDDAQAKAVAELMQACGASVEMTYTPTGSGAFTSDACKAMRLRFGYDRGIPVHYRPIESAAEFNDGVFFALSRKYPVVFGGVSTTGGHAFVLDGYNADGLVHVNWGWGENGGDGYFDIAGMNGYDVQQQYFALTKDGSWPNYASRISYPDGTVDISKVDDTHIKVSASGGRFINGDAESYSGNLYVVARNVSTGEDCLIATQSCNETVMSYYYFQLSSISKPFVTIVGKVADGTYRLFIASKSDKEAAYSPIRTTGDSPNSFFMTVANGIITNIEADTNVSWMSPTAVKTIVTDSRRDGMKYNALGQRVADSYRGMIIINGKKYLNKK